MACGATSAPDANTDAPEAGPAAAAPAAPALPHCELTWPIAELEDAELSIGERCAVEGARWFPLGGPRGMRWDGTNEAGRWVNDNKGSKDDPIDLCD